DGRTFPVADAMAIAPMQPLLRAPSLRDDGWRLPLAARGEGVADRGAMPIVPGRFDEDAPGVGVAGLGQCTAALRLPRGILARDQPQVGHEFPRPTEALKVDDLGEQDHGRG